MNVNNHHLMLCDFIENDLKNCNYNQIQHYYNLEYHLRQILKNEQRKLGENFTIDQKEIVEYYKNKHHEVISEVCAYENSKKMIS